MDLGHKMLCYIGIICIYLKKGVIMRINRNPRNDVNTHPKDKDFLGELSGATSEQIYTFFSKRAGLLKTIDYIPVIKIIVPILDSEDLSDLSKLVGIEMASSLWHEKFFKLSMAKNKHLLIPELNAMGKEDRFQLATTCDMVLLIRIMNIKNDFLKEFEEEGIYKIFFKKNIVNLAYAANSIPDEAIRKYLLEKIIPKKIMENSSSLSLLFAAANIISDVNTKNYWLKIVIPQKIMEKAEKEQWDEIIELASDAVDDQEKIAPFNIIISQIKDTRILSKMIAVLALKQSPWAGVIAKDVGIDFNLALHDYCIDKIKEISIVDIKIAVMRLEREGEKGIAKIPNLLMALESQIGRIGLKDFRDVIQMLYSVNQDFIIALMQHDKLIRYLPSNHFVNYLLYSKNEKDYHTKEKILMIILSPLERDSEAISNFRKLIIDNISCNELTSLLITYPNVVIDMMKSINSPENFDKSILAKLRVFDVARIVSVCNNLIKNGKDDKTVQSYRDFLVHFQKAYTFTKKIENIDGLLIKEAKPVLAHTRFRPFNQTTLREKFTQYKVNINDEGLCFGLMADAIRKHMQAEHAHDLNYSYFNSINYAIRDPGKNLDVRAYPSRINHFHLKFNDVLKTNPKMKADIVKPKSVTVGDGVESFFQSVLEKINNAPEGENQYIHINTPTHAMALILKHEKGKKQLLFLDPNFGEKDLTHSKEPVQFLSEIVKDCYLEDGSIELQAFTLDPSFYRKGIVSRKGNPEIFEQEVPVKRLSL